MMIDRIINGTLKFIFVGLFKLTIKFVKFVLFLVVSGALVAFLVAIYNIVKLIIGGIIKLFTNKERGAVADEV